MLNIFTDLGRLQGFVLYVSNSTGNPSPAWTSCYSDVVSQLAALVREYNCVETARYVGIYVDKSRASSANKPLNLCEVQVNGRLRKYFIHYNASSLNILTKKERLSRFKMPVTLLVFNEI